MIKFFYMLLFFVLSGCEILDFEEVVIQDLKRVVSNESISIFMCPQDQCLTPVVDFLSSAEHSLSCAFYELDTKVISNLLIEKHLLGVEIDLVIDDIYLGEESILDLHSEGVSVMSDVKRGTKYNNYMHHKFCIADDSRLLLSSANPTQNGMFYNNNNILIFESKELVEEFKNEFNQLTNGVFGQNKKQKRAIKGIEFEDGYLDVFFCPQDDCASALVSILEMAEKEIVFANFVLTLDDVETLLIEKASYGINVSGVIENRMFNSKGSRAEDLSNIFSLIRDSNPKTMHHKFFVVDSRYVVTGSMNPSSSGVNYNDEFLVIIDSQEIAREYRAEFMSLIKK